MWRAGRAALDLGPRVVVQTEGARGSYTVSRDAEFHTPAFDVDVVDTTGAGDTFHGAYLVGLARGWDLERCAVVLVGGGGLALHRAGQPQGDSVDGRGRGADGGPAGRQGGDRVDGALRTQGEKRMGRIGITFNYWGNEWMEDIEEYERRMARAAAIGFDLMSFSQDVLFLYTAEQKRRFVASAAEHGIRVNYMAGLGPKQDINSDSDENRRRGIAHLRALAETASEMQRMAGGGGADVGGAITGVMRQGLDGRDKERCWAHAVGRHARGDEDRRRPRRHLPHRGPESLRALPDQHLRRGAALPRRRGQPEPEDDARHVPHEHRGGFAGRGDRPRRRPARHLPHRREQPPPARPGAHSLGRGRRGAPRDRLRPRHRDGADRPHGRRRRQPARRVARHDRTAATSTKRPAKGSSSTAPSWLRHKPGAPPPALGAPAPPPASGAKRRPPGTGAARDRGVHPGRDRAAAWSPPARASSPPTCRSRAWSAAGGASRPTPAPRTRRPASRR